MTLATSRRPRLQNAASMFWGSLGSTLVAVSLCWGGIEAGRVDPSLSLLTVPPSTHDSRLLAGLGGSSWGRHPRRSLQEADGVLLCPLPTLPGHTTKYIDVTRPKLLVTTTFSEVQYRTVQKRSHCEDAARVFCAWAKLPQAFFVFVKRGKFVVDNEQQNCVIGTTCNQVKAKAKSSGTGAQSGMKASFGYVSILPAQPVLALECPPNGQPAYTAFLEASLADTIDTYMKPPVTYVVKPSSEECKDAARDVGLEFFIYNPLGFWKQGKSRGNCAYSEGCMSGSLYGGPDNVTIGSA